MTEPLVRVEALRKTYANRNAWGRRTGVIRAVDGVDLSIHAGETLAIVGESGSGKSTLGRAILQMEEPTSGAVHYRGADLTAASRAARAAAHRSMQVIFQDPFSSLNPHRTALQNVLEPLHALAVPGDRIAAATEALAAVGIEGDAVHKRPRAFSGGQRQRIAIARALAVRPDFIVCDEPVSALDVTIQAQVMRLLQRLQDEYDLTYLFISHDLAVVREIADRTAVMMQGRIVELAPTPTLFAAPRHAYTQRLLEAVLVAAPPVARARLAQIAARPAAAVTAAGVLTEVAPGHLVEV